MENKVKNTDKSYIVSHESNSRHVAWTQKQVKCFFERKSHAHCIVSNISTGLRSFQGVTVFSRLFKQPSKQNWFSTLFIFGRNHNLPATIEFVSQETLLDLLLPSQKLRWGYNGQKVTDFWDNYYRTRRAYLNIHPGSGDKK